MDAAKDVLGVVLAVSEVDDGNRIDEFAGVRFRRRGPCAVLVKRLFDIQTPLTVCLPLCRERSRHECLTQRATV